MGNISIITLMLYSMLAAALVSFATGRNIITTPTAAVDNTPLIIKWLNNLNPGTQKNFTVLRFYMQNVVVEKDHQKKKTVYNVTQPAIKNSATWFGLIQVVDHLITAKPDYKSENVGPVQGLHIGSDLNAPAIGVNWNLFFNDGSTIAVLGRQDPLAEDGVLSIIAGTGKYLMGRGIAAKKIWTRDSAALNSAQEYTMYVYSSFLPGSSLV